MSVQISMCDIFWWGILEREKNLIIKESPSHHLIIGVLPREIKQLEKYFVF